MEQKESFFKRMCKYRVLPRSWVLIMTAGVGLIYYIYLSASADKYFGELPDVLVKTVKFFALMLAAYPLFQSIGAEKYREELIAQVSMDNQDEEKRKISIQQLILFARDKQSYNLFPIIGFVLLALLAVVGQI